ncbi:MAG: oxidoreductase [Comamonadaceae bacterium]|nr:MAG: oxidoreductase [Comamonadaceae bacterium]
MSADTARWAWAALASALWLCLWLIPWRHARRGRAHARADALAAPWLIAYASQSGQGAQWAERTARMLAAQGCAVQLMPMNRLRAADLDAATHLLLIASTTGEGDAPDNAASFATRLMPKPRALGRLRYGVLARGDRSYASFCEFGRRLDDWLRASGATPAFSRIEADGDDPGALTTWLHECARLAGLQSRVDDETTAPFVSLASTASAASEASAALTASASASAPASAAPQSPQAEAPLSDPQRWRLLQRHVINPGSPGAPVHHVVLEPLEAGARWQSGDVARIHIPARHGQPATWRDYSLASLPHEGRAELLVREVRHPNGTPGLGSGWLCHQLALGDALDLQLRRNPGFHAPAPQVPLILIGNGTGLAGLAAHMKAREHARHAGAQVGPAWLLLGERSRANDSHWHARLLAWRTQGLLQRLDLAFSRDAPAAGADGAHYVQDLIAPLAATLRTWVADGAALYVCGQRDGMAQGVHRALGEVLGGDVLEELTRTGRYRRDVY